MDTGQICGAIMVHSSLMYALFVPNSEFIIMAIIMIMGLTLIINGDN